MVSNHHFSGVKLLKTHRGVSGRKSIPVIRMTPKRHCTPNATLHPTGNLSHTRSAMKLTMRPTVMASWLRDTSLPLKLFGASSALYTGTIMLRMLEREKERGIRKLDAGEKELGGRLAKRERNRCTQSHSHNHQHTARND